MTSNASYQLIRMLYIPPYYENHFQLATDRLETQDKDVEYQIFTIDIRFLPITTDLNSILSMCRSIIREERIKMLFSDSHIGQVIIAKLWQEYPESHDGGMNFLSILQCIDRFLMIDLFGIDECVPTLRVGLTKDCDQSVQPFLPNSYVKSRYSFDNQLSSFIWSNGETCLEMIEPYIELYKKQYMTSLLPFFRIYVPMPEYPLVFQPSYLIQPFYDLTTDPYWRLVIASACIYDKEIIMWPLVDGYSGWPFLGEQPLAIMPILVCPSRQISMEQQDKIYIRFRQHLNHLITNHNLCYGWMECSYFISRTNEIRLISIKPTYSVYLMEAFNSTNQYGNPFRALAKTSTRQRPQTPILNGKTVYIHRLWANIQDQICTNDLINMTEIKRIHRSNLCMNSYVRLRFQEDELISNDHPQKFIEIGFIQVHGKYHEIRLANLIEFRHNLLKKPEVFPFAHYSMLSHNGDQFDPITCLPSKRLLEQLEKLRKQTGQDLI